MPEGYSVKKPEEPEQLDEEILDDRASVIDLTRPSTSTSSTSTARAVALDSGQYKAYLEQTRAWGCSHRYASEWQLSRDFANIRAGLAGVPLPNVVLTEAQEQEVEKELNAAVHHHKKGDLGLPYEFWGFLYKENLRAKAMGLSQQDWPYPLLQRTHLTLRHGKRLVDPPLVPEFQPGYLTEAQVKEIDALEDEYAVNHPLASIAEIESVSFTNMVWATQKGRPWRIFTSPSRAGTPTDMQLLSPAQLAPRPLASSSSLSPSRAATPAGTDEVSPDKAIATTSPSTSASSSSSSSSGAAASPSAAPVAAALPAAAPVAAAPPAAAPVAAAPLKPPTAAAVQYHTALMTLLLKEHKLSAHGQADASRAFWAVLCPRVPPPPPVDSDSPSSDNLRTLARNLKATSIRLGNKLLPTPFVVSEVWKYLRAGGYDGDDETDSSAMSEDEADQHQYFKNYRVQHPGCPDEEVEKAFAEHQRTHERSPSQPGPGLFTQEEEAPPPQSLAPIPAAAPSQSATQLLAGIDATSTHAATSTPKDTADQQHRERHDDHRHHRSSSRHQRRHHRHHHGHHHGDASHSPSPSASRSPSTTPRSSSPTGAMPEQPAAPAPSAASAPTSSTPSAPAAPTSYSAIATPTQPATRTPHTSSSSSSTSSTTPAPATAAGSQATPAPSPSLPPSTTPAPPGLQTPAPGGFDQSSQSQGDTQAATPAPAAAHNHDPLLSDSGTQAPPPSGPAAQVTLPPPSQP